MGGRGRRLRGGRRYFFRQLRGRWRGLWRRAGGLRYSRLPAPADAIAQRAADVARTDLTNLAVAPGPSHKSSREEDIRLNDIATGNRSDLFRPALAKTACRFSRCRKSRRRLRAGAAHAEQYALLASLYPPVLP